MDDEFAPARACVEEVLSAAPFLLPWVFEHTPASAQGVQEAYLEKVRRSVFWLVGSRTTDPARHVWRADISELCDLRIGYRPEHLAVGHMYRGGATGERARAAEPRVGGARCARRAGPPDSDLFGPGSPSSHS